MDRKTMYWIIGALAVVLVILLAMNFRGAASGTGTGSTTQAAESSSTSQAAVADSASQTGAASHMHDMESTNGSSAADPLTAYIAEQDQIMMDMMEDMKLDTPSGNASVDFLMGMIPHHESAIAMAESLLKYGGENEEIKKLAEDIISVQQDEIEEMNEMIKDFSTEGHKDEEKEAAYLAEYNKMFDDPHAHHVDTGSVKTVDEAFAIGMISHHQMAVDMARSIFEYTDSDRLKEMAQNIIEVQEQEIAQMQELLKEMRAQ